MLSQWIAFAIVNNRIVIMLMRTTTKKSCGIIAYSSQRLTSTKLFIVSKLNIANTSIQWRWERKALNRHANNPGSRNTHLRFSEFKTYSCTTNRLVKNWKIGIIILSVLCLFTVIWWEYESNLIRIKADPNYLDRLIELKRRKMLLLAKMLAK